jgi:hypothetical protein
MASVPAIRQGLMHPDAVVREHCCKLLDHLLVDDAVNDLIAMLDDRDARVRVAALHALSCDRCKTDSCRPPTKPLYSRWASSCSTKTPVPVCGPWPQN